jgi:hypothetical protein
VQNKSFQNNVGIQVLEEGRKFQLDWKYYGIYRNTTGTQELYKDRGKFNLKEQSL